MADDTGRNIAAQVEMYGEPLARVFGRLVEQLGMTQAALARTLGMSPAMLSHLSSGTRVKIGNPAVQRRLDEVRTLAEQIGRGEVSRDEVQPLLDGIRESTGSWTATRHDAPDQGETDRDATEAATVAMRRDFMLPAYNEGVLLAVLEAALVQNPRVVARPVGMLDIDAVVQAATQTV